MIRVGPNAQLRVVTTPPADPDAPTLRELEGGILLSCVVIQVDPPAPPPIRTEYDLWVDRELTEMVDHTMWHVYPGGRLDPACTRCVTPETRALIAHRLAQEVRQ